MDPEKDNVWFYNFKRKILGKGPMKIHQELEYVYGIPSCSYATVCRRIKAARETSEINHISKHQNLP